MARKKKRHNKQQQKAAFRTHNKKQHAILFKKMDEVTEAIGCPDILHSISPIIKRFLYYGRFHPLKVVAGENCPISNSYIKSLQTYITDYTHKNYFSFPGSNKKFTYADYFTVVTTLNEWLMLKNVWKIPDWDYIKKSFRPLINYCNGEDTPVHALQKFIDIISNMISTPDTFTCYMQVSVISRSEPRLYFAISIEFNVRRASSQVVKFDGHTRLVYLLPYLKNGPCVLKIKAGELYPGSAISNMEMEVYIQMHALDRIAERLDCFELQSIRQEIVMSFENREIIPDPSRKGCGLVPFIFFGYKMGYFVVEAVEGLAVIRTFLFLTNDGTPEGKKLQQRLGLSKMDKMYYRLDKLSTFMLSDICEDKTLHKILEETGCDHLLHINERFVDSTLSQQMKGATPSAEELKKYLMLEEEGR